VQETFCRVVPNFRKAELKLSNSDVDSIENNVISVCYLVAEDESILRDSPLFIRLSSPFILYASEFRPDLQLNLNGGWAYPGKGRYRCSQVQGSPFKVAIFSSTLLVGRPYRIGVLFSVNH